MKNKRKEGREEGKADELHMSESKQLFNCVWRRAEATAVNNLCTAETHQRTVSICMAVPVCMCQGSFSDLVRL